ncbi:MAG: hypothetical protein IPL26_26250 [Leptospiraceae bacterium]|nr:hypothetical protein [Leptospiraceae bacterium]
MSSEIPYLKKLEFVGTSPLKRNLGFAFFLISLFSILYVFYINSKLSLDDKLDYFGTLINENKFNEAELFQQNNFGENLNFENNLRVISGNIEIHRKKSDWNRLYEYVKEINLDQDTNRINKLKLFQLYLDTSRSLFFAKEYKKATDIYRLLITKYIYIPPIADLEYEIAFKEIMANENKNLENQLKLKITKITMPMTTPSVDDYVFNCLDRIITCKEKEVDNFYASREKAAIQFNKFSSEEKVILIKNLLVGLKMNPSKYYDSINSICAINEGGFQSEYLKITNSLSLSDICNKEDFISINGKEYFKKFGILFFLDKKVEEKNIPCLQKQKNNKRVYLVDKLTCKKEFKERYNLDILILSNENYYTLNTDPYSFD